MRAIDKPIHRNELIRLVRECIEAEGEDCDLNHIDVSAMTDFRSVFQVQPFKGDISRWNMSNATSLCRMFQGSTFNGDISGWDVSKVVNFSDMFSNGKFNGDVSQWSVGNAENMSEMFSASAFEGDVSRNQVQGRPFAVAGFANGKRARCPFHQHHGLHGDKRVPLGFCEQQFGPFDARATKTLGRNSPHCASHRHGGQRSFALRARTVVP